MAKKKRTKVIRAADLFCGAGGTSTGLKAACDALGHRLELLAVNHWAVAIETHSANHPWAKHRCTGIDEIDPRKAVPSGKLDVLIASPECMHHSNARGGRPMCDQSRATAWHVLRWCEALYIRSVLIENVPEFKSWGPLGSNGRPLKSKKGALFNQFIGSLEALGYRVDFRVLNAADFGAATSRRRLFIQARRGRKPLWPAPTHAKGGAAADLLEGDRAPWRPARDVIDWEHESRSIFTRKRPLAESTMRRIMAGLKKFGLAAFLTELRGTNNDQIEKHTAHSLERPVPAISSGGIHAGLVEPFIVQTDQTGGNGNYGRSVDAPLGTCISKQNQALVEPYLVPFHGENGEQTPRSHSVDQPLPVIPAGGVMAGLAEPYLVTVNHGRKDTEKGGVDRRAHSVDDPLSTITAINGKGLAQPYLVKSYKGSDAASLDDPLPTVTAKYEHLGLAQPFLVKFNGTGTAVPITDPLPTLTAKDRLGLVEPQTGETYLIDIHFRMLQPHELSAGMGFPADYEFAGTRADQVRQIGNAVEVNQARALCEALLIG